MNWRWSLAAAGVLVAIAIFIVGLYAFIPAGHRAVDWYAILDADTLLIGTVTGDGESIRVDVSESPTEVRLTVQAFSWPFVVHADLGREARLVVELEAPLDDRPVVDEFHTVPLKTAP